MNFFICPGAQKAGTTLLYDILSQHKEIHISSKKETKYFLRKEKDISKDEYINLFYPSNKDSKAEPLIYGEIDPEYLYFKDVAEKLYNTLGGDIKLIFLLRHPVDRAYSHYWMSYRKGFDFENFEKAVQLEKNRIALKPQESGWHHSYLSRGFYFEQIKNYLNYYSMDQMLFISFEDLIKNKQKTIDTICSFLDITPIVLTEEALNKKSNEGNMPKSDFLRRIHHSPANWKNVLKIFLPHPKLRRWLYPFIEKFNRSDKKYPRLKDEWKRKLFKENFSEDCQNLDLLLKTDFHSKWKNN